MRKRTNPVKEQGGAAQEPGARRSIDEPEQSLEHLPLIGGEHGFHARIVRKFRSELTPEYNEFKKAIGTARSNRKEDEPFSTFTLYALATVGLALVVLWLHHLDVVDAPLPNLLPVRPPQVPGDPISTISVQALVHAAVFAFTVAVYQHSSRWGRWSFTMFSWTLILVRSGLVCLQYGLASVAPGPPLSLAAGAAGRVADALLAPAMAQASVVVVVWWVVLTPLLVLGILVKVSPEQRCRRLGQFMQFNFRPLLLCIHAANLPLATVDQVWLRPRPLYQLDLLVCLTLVYAYGLLYTFVLAPSGLNFYVILDPRSHATGVVYVLLLALLGYVVCIWDVGASGSQQGAVVVRWLQARLVT